MIRFPSLLTLTFFLAAALLFGCSKVDSPKKDEAKAEGTPAAAQESGEVVMPSEVPEGKEIAKDAPKADRRKLPADKIGQNLRDKSTPDKKIKRPDALKNLRSPNKKEIPAPEDVAAPPKDAHKTASGLSYKVLEAGTGGEKPGPNDMVKVNYTGWTTDGKMFDTSEGRDPLEFLVGGVIPGWTEGLQLMAKGQKVRLWIPEELAYKGRPGAPAGMLVFNVELLDFTKGPTPPTEKEAPADAEKHENGVASKVLTAGKGEAKASKEATVTLHFEGWTGEGVLFDSTQMRKSPMTMPVARLFPGWSIGVQQMVAGEKRRIWIPEDQAFKGRPGAPAGTIVMDVELIEIKEPPKAPADVAAPPADAEKTASGLASKVLKPGTGTKHPAATSKVEVHYSGWTTDGKMFDSSVSRGKPASFGLNGVIAGWTEGLQLMVEGETRRFWIPEDLAYKGKPGRPAGMLVFDVELLKIMD